MANYQAIDAVPVLSRWYGPDSIACHTVKIISPDEAESEFTVRQNLCGPLARPPMLDRLTFLNGVFTTQTSAEDAREHFIKSVGISVVPGHNIMGLVAEGLERVHDNKDQTLNTVGFDFMRFRGFILPGQEVKFSGEVDKRDRIALATLVMALQRRPFTQNFCLEMGEVLDNQSRQKLLAQHWIFEANAQGLGMFGLTLVKEGMVPVLMEVGRSTFAKIPILEGDVLRSHFTNVLVDDEQITGDVKSFVGKEQVAHQENFLLQFVPIEKLTKAIEGVQIL